MNIKKMQPKNGIVLSNKKRKYSVKAVKSGKTISSQK